MAKRKASPAQLRARKNFARMARCRSKKSKRSNMARRKVRRASPRRRSSYRRRKSGSSGVSVKNRVLGGLVYGAVRQKASDLAVPLTSRLGMFGAYADNVALGGIAWYAAKKTRGMVRDIALSALTFESALAGMDLVGGLSGTKSNAGSGDFSATVF